jgi:hypothetical protein
MWRARVPAHDAEYTVLHPVIALHLAPGGLRERVEVVAEAGGVAVVAALGGVLSSLIRPGLFAAVHSPLDGGGVRA